MPSGHSVVLPPDPTEYIAAAMCFAMAADPMSLDPAGQLTSKLWPWPHLTEFAPRPDPVQNLQAAQRHLSRAILLSRTELTIVEGVGA